MVSESFKNSRSLIIWPIFSHYFRTKIKSNHSHFCHFCFRAFLKKKKIPVKSSLCSQPPRSRSGVYSYKITNQIPQFSRSNTACSNAARIDPIKRWTCCHALVEFPAVRSRAAPSDPRASRVPYHTLCHVSLIRISNPRFA